MYFEDLVRPYINDESFIVVVVVVVTIFLKLDLFILISPSLVSECKIDSRDREKRFKRGLWNKVGSFL